MLLFDIKYPAGTSTDPLGPVFGQIHSPAMDALRLCSSAGLEWYRTWVYPLPPTTTTVHFFDPTTSHVRDSHLPSPSILDAGRFDECRRLFDVLLNNSWGSWAAFTNILTLAREYHRLTFTLENPAHAFLILMVIFEALFKKEHERNADLASRRIGKLLGSTQQ